MSVALPYSVVIRWSDEDGVYIAHLPEFGNGAKTHGDTYVQAVTNAQEVLEMLVESYRSEGRALPNPEKYVHSQSPKVSRAASSATNSTMTKQLAKQR